jgi:serine protease SohB
MQPILNILELILLILAILVGFAVLGTIARVPLRLLRTKRVAKKRPESHLEITHLDKDLADRVYEAKRSLLPEKERKKSKRSKAEKQYDSTVFVVDFHPSLRAHEVDKLREEIDIITQVATPKDEVVVRIDSAGGTVNAYGHAASQLLRIREARIPLTICVDEIAASGGYMCAAVADKIIAAPFAYIGSIGVVTGMPNFVGLMQKLGVRYVELTAGANKRTLTPFSEPTPQQEAIELERLRAIHSAFKALIKQRRPNLDIDKVADGNYWLALDAKELGLVDIIETSDEYLSKQSSANRRILKISCKSKTANLLERLLDAIR